ncbi:MAG TPA: methionine--tRNA ligase [Candidatus Paceibacterota bacterium]
MISIDDFAKVEIRAGKILSVEEVEGSDKLLKLSVDFGSASIEISADKEERDVRQVVSGIKKYFLDPQSLVGVTSAFVTNLEPRMIMGLESQAMLMASSGKLENEESFFSLLKMDVPPGSIVK